MRKLFRVPLLSLIMSIGIGIIRMVGNSLINRAVGYAPLPELPDKKTFGILREGADENGKEKSKRERATTLR